MEYEELVAIVIMNDLKRKYDVVCYSIGYKGEFNREDFNNVSRLFLEGYIED